MKFTAVVVLLGLALAVEASHIPVAHHGYPGWGHHGHGAWDDGSYHHGAYDDGHHGGWAAHGTHGISLDQGHHGYGHHGAHGISLSQGHGHHYAPAHHGHHDYHHDHHHHAHYVAKTLGAVHSAPLVGHHDDVKSFNVAHAPGTHY